MHKGRGMQARKTLLICVVVVAVAGLVSCGGRPTGLPDGSQGQADSGSTQGDVLVQTDGPGTRQDLGDRKDGDDTLIGPEAGTTCVPEGVQFTDPNPAGRCCPGLKPVPATISDGLGGCLSPNCPCYVCTHCGDLSCGLGENGCNCPKDCKKTCYKEGELFTKIGNPDVMCCKGLSAVQDCFPMGPTCECPGSPDYRCAKCGDKSCGPFENWCNCAKDCPMPP